MHTRQLATIPADIINGRPGREPVSSPRAAAAAAVVDSTRPGQANSSNRQANRFSDRSSPLQSSSTQSTSLTLNLPLLPCRCCPDTCFHVGTVEAASATAFAQPTAADILPTSGTTDPAILATIPPLDAQPSNSIQAASVSSSAAVPQKLIAPDSTVVSEAGAASDTPLTAKGRPIRINRRQYTQALAALQKADAAAAAEGRVSAQAAATPALQAVLNEHNSYRSRHAAPAMTWDDAAAAGAAGYAARCIWGHDANRGPYGENLFATSVKDANAALSQTTKAW